MQVKQWRAIHKKYAEEMKDHAKRHEIMAKMGKELEATLTKEQLVKFRKHKPQNMPPPPKRNE